jgi:hypothetical protein
MWIQIILLLCILNLGISENHLPVKSVDDSEIKFHTFSVAGTFSLPEHPHQVDIQADGSLSYIIQTENPTSKPTANVDDNNSTDDDEKLAPDAVAGVVIGAIAFCFILGYYLYTQLFDYTGSRGGPSLRYADHTSLLGGSDYNSNRDDMLSL